MTSAKEGILPIKDLECLPAPGEVLRFSGDHLEPAVSRRQTDFVDMRWTGTGMATPAGSPARSSQRVKTAVRSILACRFRSKVSAPAAVHRNREESYGDGAALFHAIEATNRRLVGAMRTSGGVMRTNAC